VTDAETGGPARASSTAPPSRPAAFGESPGRPAPPTARRAR